MRDKSMITVGLGSTSLELAWVTVANLAITLLTVVIGIVLARHFRVDDYGQFSYFVNVFGLFRLLSALGMTSQISYEMANRRGQGMPVASRFYVLLMVRVATVIAVTMAVVGAAYLQRDSIMMLAAVVAAIALVGDFGIGALQGLGRVSLAVMVVAAQPILYSTGVLAVVFRDLSLSTIYLVYGLSFAVALILSAACLVKLLRFPARAISEPWNLSLAIRFAGGMYLFAISGTVFTSFATFYLGAVGRFVDVAQLAIPLSLIFTPSTVLNMAITTVYFPRISEMYGRGDNENAEMLFAFFLRLVSGATVLVSVILMLFPEAILGLLYGNRYDSSSTILMLAAPAACLWSVQIVLSVTIVGQGRVREALLGGFISAGFVASAVAVLSSLAGSVPGGDLPYYAVAYSLGAVLGLVWQCRIVGYRMQKLVLQMGTQFAVAFCLAAAGRLLVPNISTQLLEAIALPALVSIAYLLWLWHSLSTAQPDRLSWGAW